MKEKIKHIAEQISNYNIKNIEELEKFRIEFLSKKGIITQLFTDFKNVEPHLKKDLGQVINELKIKAQNFYNTYKEDLGIGNENNIKNDLTLPSFPFESGSRHPVSIARQEILSIFSKLGFSVADGPEIEDDWHVFSALNFPPEHPARDMQDTFFIEKDPDILLRTHTSSVQVRAMETTNPPLRIVMPGRVFRNEAISARSHCIFHQIEGLYIDKNVSFADLKQTLLTFSKELFGESTKIRLRPSFFPFTEPSAEMDVSCTCGGKGCNLCKYTGWLEIMGCGMVDPQVFESCGIDSKVYTGFAFGMGIERIALLKYGIKDIRMLFENDIRFLEQFKVWY